jgi:hypothetical protein
VSHHSHCYHTLLITSSQDDVKATQKDLEANLVGVISSRESYPVPGRALRNLVASCFLTLYARGDSKNMFDTLIAFLKVASDFKAPADRDQHKMCVLALSPTFIHSLCARASLYCIGELMGTFGTQVRIS